MVKNLAKRKRFGRIRRYYKKARRNISSQKIPLEVALTLIGSPFTAPAPGWATPWESAQRNQIGEIPRSLQKGFMGWVPGESVNIWGILNPMDFSYAPYMKGLILAGLVSKLRKKLVKVPFNKIPFVGRMVS
jgi:hypothetical protein